jgi:uncharacterized protein YbaA (DUF1428 family)
VGLAAREEAAARRILDEWRAGIPKAEVQDFRCALQATPRS